MTRRRRWGVTLGVLLLLLTGCWDQRPVEGRAVVEAVGVQPTRQPGVWQWTFVFPSPTESINTLGTSSPASEVYALAVQARTWTRALLAAQQETTRDLYFGQFRVLALSPRLPAAVWARLITTFNRSGRILKTFWIVDASPADLVVRTPPASEGTPLYGLFKLLACHCQPYLWGQRAWQAWDRLATPGVSLEVPVIRLNDQQLVRNPAMAVLGSKRLVEWSPMASAGWAYLTQHVVKGGLAVSVGSETIGLNRVRGTSHVAVAAIGSHRQVTVRLSYRGDLEDVPATVHLTPTEKATIAAAASHQILQWSQTAVRDAEQQQVDPFGWHRESAWALNTPGDPWPAPVSWQDWSVHLRVRFRISGEGVAH